MKKKVLLIGLIALAVLLAGCTTSETPRGDISAPVNGGNAMADANETQKEFYSIGETIRTKRTALEITLKNVVQIENCTSEGPCIGAYLKVKNVGEEKEADALYGSVILDDQGKQHEKIYTSYCPNEYETGDIFPGVTKEGFVCFESVSDRVRTIKLIIDVGLWDSSKIVYLINANQIKNAEKKAELEIGEVESTWYSNEFTSGSGTIQTINFSIKNTGGVYLDNLKVDYTIKKGERIIASDNNNTLYGTVEPGKTEEESVMPLESVTSKGEYSIEMILKDSAGELARATKAFNVN